VKKLWLIILVAFLCFGFFYYRFYQSKRGERLAASAYNQFTGQWEETKASTEITKRSNITKTDNNDDGLHNYSILKGYFDKYDAKAQTLTLKVAIAFTQNSLFEIADFKFSPIQTIYCAPIIYTDPNTGRNYSLEKLISPVKDGATLYFPGEQTISFADFIEKSNNLTFLLAQLTKNFDKTTTNYIQKIIVTGLCD